MANLRFLQTQSFAIQASGASIGDTSIVVQSFKYPDGVTNIVTADLGDQCYGTLEPNNGTQEEAIQFTGVTQNANGTATLTGVSSVGFSYPYTVTSGLAKSHAGGITLILSNDAAMYGNIVSYINTVVASGAPTATDTVAGISKTTFNQGSNPRTRSTLISQHLTGDMTMLVNTFSYQNGGTTITFTGKTLAYINGVLTSTFVAPVSNSRYDLIVYRPSLSDCTSITGTENASPSLPTPTVGDIVLCSIFHRVGETKILDRSDGVNGYIFSWYEPTPYITATSLTNQGVTFGTDQSQATTNATYAVGEANATTKHSLVAQSFVPTVTGIQGVKLWKIADTGSFTGSVKISLQASVSGSPSGSDLAAYTITNASWLKLNNAAEFAVAFSTEYESMVVGNTYWIVVSPTTSDNSNHPNLGYDNASAHSLVLKFNNSTDGWVTTATAALYFKSTTGILGKVVQTDSTQGQAQPNVLPYSLILSSRTPITVANSTTPTTVASKQIEGGFMSTTSGLRVKVWGYYGLTGGASGTQTLTVDLKYNGSSICTSTFLANGTTNAITQWRFIMEGTIINNNSLSSQLVNFYWTYNPVAVNGTATTASMLADTGTNTTTANSVDFSQPGLFEIVFTNGNSSNWSSFYQGSLIEKIG